MVYCQIQPKNVSVKMLSVDELERAEREIVKHVQRIAVPEVLRALQKISSAKYSRQVTTELKNLRMPTFMPKFHPLLDEFGILRVGGRLENAIISSEAKHPVVLPYQHHVTDLIISQHHQITRHLGQEYVLSSLPQHYWIIKGRSAVRRVLNKCFRCKKLEAPSGEQLMANLPKERLMSGELSFSYLGVDYFGPLVVRQGGLNVKCYGCLFTFLVIRAVHIQVVPSFDTDNCRVTYGCSLGTNYQIQSQNPLSFARATGHSDEMLQTLMSEIHGILNSQPLTSDPNDLDPLTPNHLLLFEASSNLPPGSFCKEDVYSKCNT